MRGAERSQHEPDGGKMEEGNRLAVEVFPVLGQPAGQLSRRWFV